MSKAVQSFQPSASARLCLQWPKQLNAGLAEVDPELYDIIEKEKNRQWKVSKLPCLLLPTPGQSGQNIS